MDAARIQARAVIKVTAICLAVIAAAVLLAIVVLHTRTTLRWLFAAVFLMLALLPAVDAIHHRVRLRGHGMPRWLAIVVVYLLAAALFSFLVLAVIPPIVRDVEGLASKAPDLRHGLRGLGEAATTSSSELNDKYHLTQKLQRPGPTLPSKLGDAAGAVKGITVAVLDAPDRGASPSSPSPSSCSSTGASRSSAGGRPPARATRRARWRRIGTRVAAVVRAYVTVNLVLAAASGVLHLALPRAAGDRPRGPVGGPRRLLRPDAAGRADARRRAGRDRRRPHDSTPAPLIVWLSPSSSISSSRTASSSR